MRTLAHETTKSLPHYDHAYAGEWFWNYTRPSARLREYLKVKQYVLEGRRTPKDSEILEVACGQGYHVDLMRRLGMNAIGVDLSREATKFAKATFPDGAFLHLDATEELPFQPESFDLVWSHGAGFFHYCITDDATARVVQSHLRLVKPGGRYVVVISSDLSGNRPPPSEPYRAKVWMHTIDDFRSMLRRHGMPFRVAWHAKRRWIPLVGPKLRTGWLVGSIEKP